MTLAEFQADIRAGIPDRLPAAKPYDRQINHAPKRKDILTPAEKELALRNALRYFPARHHAVLAREFAAELRKYGRIYMYRLRPDYEMHARPIDEYPAKCRQAAAIMLMIQNNLDKAVAQHPHELITYGGNGAVFQNWAQYRLTMKYLSEMTDRQTLVMYSGHPLGLFPSHPDAPRVVVTNGMVIPNYSKPDDWERMNALGVSQYGQMTAGSYMYIGPQGIVHGTTITVMNAARKRFTGDRTSARGMLFVSSGLGGMSGAQPKAGNISGVVSVVAEINPKAARKRFEQGWVDELHESLDELIPRIRQAVKSKEVVSLAYVGNVVDLWERLADEGIDVDLGSDQTSLHNPWAGGYYPVGLSYEASNKMMAEEPARFRECVQESLRRQVDAINRLTARGMYFFDYGNAFLLEASRAGAAVMGEGGRFRYPSYVQDIMGPMFFDYGFGPFRWVCTSGRAEDLDTTDRLAAEVLEEMLRTAPDDIRGQLEDNLHWIREAGRNRLVVGSQARILYADCEGRTRIAQAFNRAIADGRISAPVVLGRDHHDVSGTDSPYRETSNIYDGSCFTADMAVQNVIGDAFRGATWVSIHNGGGLSPVIDGEEHTPTGNFPKGYEVEYTDSLSNKSRSHTMAHGVSLNLNYTDKTWEITTGLSVTPKRQTLDQKTGWTQADTLRYSVNYHPTLTILWRKRKTWVQLSYEGNTQQPGLAELLTLTDNSDPLNIIRGNPDLKSSYTQKVRFEVRDTKTGLSGDVNWTSMLNNVTRAVIYDSQTGGIESRPVNVNGNWNIKAAMRYQKRINHYFNLSARTGTSFIQSVSLVNDGQREQPERSVTHNRLYNAGLRVGYQPKWGGFDLSGDWRFRHSTNLLRETNNYIRDYSFGLTAYAVFPGNIRLKSETTHTFRNGTNINRSEDNEVVWNLHLSWSFLKYKKAEFSVYWADILSQKKSYSRNVTSHGLSERYTQQIGSYFIVSFKYRFNRQL